MIDRSENASEGILTRATTLTAAPAAAIAIATAPMIPMGDAAGEGSEPACEGLLLRRGLAQVRLSEREPQRRPQVREHLRPTLDDPRDRDDEAESARDPRGDEELPSEEERVNQVRNRGGG